MIDWFHDSNWLWWLSLALVVIGILGFVYGFAGTNIEAPQASDPGNKFIWPSICIAVARIALFGAKTLAGIIWSIAHH